MSGKPPTLATLTWEKDLRFSGTSGHSHILIDSDGEAGPSPMQTLAFALAGCMGMDLVHILTKGRHPPSSVRARLVGHRAQEDPYRFLRIELTFTVGGAVPQDAMMRAVALSREKYCSVWQSMRQDIEFIVTCTSEHA